jgi:hypothetical protein
MKHDQQLQLLGEEDMGFDAVQQQASCCMMQLSSLAVCLWVLVGQES